MSLATLLVREDISSGGCHLSTLVEKCQKQQLPPKNGPQYRLNVTSTHLELLLVINEATDEGFESDIDSLSIVSLEDNKIESETDSANGSSSSSSSSSEDSEDDGSKRCYYNLVDCVCYTDIKSPHLLIFVIKNDGLVFYFNDVVQLRNFYFNFTTVKATTTTITTTNNYKNISNNSSGGSKFNLMQRTDRNGVTHIEITRQQQEQEEEEEPLRKVWRSAEDLLMDSTPKRPERRKKKGRAPPPPIDVFRGEYVRVNVAPTSTENFIAKSQKSKSQQNQQQPILTMLKKPHHWQTLSIPRQHQPKIFTPMAYRYIDTLPPPMSHRFFGLSSKIRDFGGGSGGERGTTTTSSSSNSNLKSVIKKDERSSNSMIKDNNKKKVTFSAYATVQVV